MSVVASAAADGFIERLPKDIRFFLVHGLDEGLVHERARAIVRKALAGDGDPLRLIRLDGDAIARDPGLLADEAYAISMFGGARAIWIDAQGRDLAAALEPLFARPPADCVIVIKAGQLKKGTPLRSAFETKAAAAAIECYSDDARALGPLIDAEARAAGLAVAPEARSALIALLGADRQTTRGEIAKLMLYARGRPTVSAEDVEAIVSDAAPSVLDDLIDRALGGELAAVAALATPVLQRGRRWRPAPRPAGPAADASASAADRNGPGKVVRRGLPGALRPAAAGGEAGARPSGGALDVRIARPAAARGARRQRQRPHRPASGRKPRDSHALGAGLPSRAVRLRLALACGSLWEKAAPWALGRTSVFRQAMAAG